MNITYHDFPQQVALAVGNTAPLQIYHIWRLAESKPSEDSNANAVNANAYSEHENNYEWHFYEACSNIRLVWKTLEHARKHRFYLKDLSGWRIAVCRDRRYIQVLTPYQVEKMAMYKIPFEQLTPQSANEKELSATLY
jgi:hypothetical protein